MIKAVGNPSEMDPSDVWNQWPEELLNIDRKTYRKLMEDGRYSATIELGDAKSFTMGKLPYLFYNKKNRLTRDRMKEYLDTIFKEEYRQKPGGTIGAIDWIDFQSYKRNPNSFISDCDNIRDACSIVRFINFSTQSSEENRFSLLTRVWSTRSESNRLWMGFPPRSQIFASTATISDVFR